MSTYNLTGLYIATHDSSFGGYPVKYVATIEMPIERFRACKGDLGALVLDVNNDLYRGYKVPAHAPHVDGMRDRAKEGVKTLTFTYFSTLVELAAQLGLPVHTFKGAGLVPKYGAHCNLFVKKAA